MKSEVDYEENEEYQEGSGERNLLTCFSCNFETENIDELDEHILVNHDDEEDVDNPDEKFQIVAEEVPNTTNNNRKRHLESPVLQALAKNIPRAKIIIKKHETKFKLCKDTNFSMSNDSPPRKRTKRTPAEEMQCHLCPFVTRKKSVLATHMLNHSDVIPPVYYKCSQCPYQTKRKNDMPKHMLGHCSNESVPLYKCSYCPYITKRKGDLPKHEMNHVESDKIYSWNCTECEYSSKRKNDLHKHMLIHSDRQLTGVFKCLKCAYATDKGVKFSRHVLSKCVVWDEPISLEHLMLEDILANVDESGVHVVLDTDSDAEGEARVQSSKDIQYVEGEEDVEYIEYVEDGDEENGAIVVEGEIIDEQHLQAETDDVHEVEEVSEVEERHENS